ncbi:DoxX family protein [Streptomyces sp. NPDC051561]|uniref:DoxX family protein n=1 Tax=Streptomyces sp. NPDC051561 TaxID=3365658 RepID=UPI00379A817A
MFTAYVVVTILTIIANGAVAATDYSRAPWVLANSAEVHVPDSWLFPLATLKAAGAAGLLIGLLGLRPVGAAAAIGLVLFFAGAVITHVHHRVFHNIAFPLTYFALAVGSLVTVLSW